MNWFMSFTVAHPSLFTIIGAIITAVSVLVLVIAFPVEHQESRMVKASSVGDSGLGYAASFVRTWGWRRAVYFTVPMIGAGLAMLPYLAPMLLVAK